MREKPVLLLLFQKIEDEQSIHLILNKTVKKFTY